MYFYIGIEHKAPQAPVIISHPQNIEITKGHRVILEVMACGTIPLYYQWYFENDIIPGMLHYIVYMS